MPIIKCLSRSITVPGMLHSCKIGIPKPRVRVREVDMVICRLHEPTIQQISRGIAIGVAEPPHVSAGTDRPFFRKFIWLVIMTNDH